MSLKKAVADAISGWFAKRPDLEKVVTNEFAEFSAWLAKQPGANDMALPLRCPACSYEWTSKVDLTKTNLIEATKAAVRCPICGAEKSRIRK